jgi:hypothetical protein
MAISTSRFTPEKIDQFVGRLNSPCKDSTQVHSETKRIVDAGGKMGILGSGNAVHKYGAT